MTWLVNTDVNTRFTLESNHDNANYPYFKHRLGIRPDAVWIRRVASPRRGPTSYEPIIGTRILAEYCVLK